MELPVLVVEEVMDGHQVQAQVLLAEVLVTKAQVSLV
jgi:hypothetical protein